MTPRKAQATPVAAVTDADVQAIIEKGEAGIADMIAAYEPYEQSYFAAAMGSYPVAVTNAIDTQTR